MTSKQRVLDLFAGGHPFPLPVFSGMGSVTIHGLAGLGVPFPRLHADAVVMCEAALSTWRLFGFESVVMPFDVGVEAEALGHALNLYENAPGEILYPTVRRKAEAKAENLAVPADLEQRGRMPVVAEAIRLARRAAGDAVAVGAYVLAPFTLAGQALELDQLLKLAGKNQGELHAVLERAAEVTVRTARLYRRAGADFLTIREDGASTDILSPRMFRVLIQPHLRRVFAALDGPTVLNISGGTQTIVEAMADCGATAVSVDQKNDLAASRLTLGPGKLLFGNLDPAGLLAAGSPAVVRDGVRRCILEGADAVWPGSDLWPGTPAENLRAMVAAARETQPLRTEYWRR